MRRIAGTQKELLPIGNSLLDEANCNCNHSSGYVVAQSEEIMKTIMNQLSTALASGAWTWWAAKYPLVFQIEFDHTLVQTRGFEHQGKIALAFHGLSSVSFLERGAITKGWAYALNANKIEGFEVTPEAMFFNDQHCFDEMLKEAFKTDVVYGASPQGIAFKTAKLRFGFWAGNVGVLIAASALKLFDMHGEISLGELEIMKPVCA